MREIKFRAFIGNEMIGADRLAYEEYGLLKDQLGAETALMQYTGLKDKNGKEIYEGDILADDSSRYYEVIWSYYFWGIKHDFFGITGIKHNTHLRFEVIGNIYSNPELLNK